MDIAIVGEEPLLVSVEEIGAVVDGCLLRGRTTENLGAPGISGAMSAVSHGIYTINSSM